MSLAKTGNVARQYAVQNPVSLPFLRLTKVGLSREWLQSALECLPGLTALELRRCYTFVAEHEAEFPIIFTTLR